MQDATNEAMKVIRNIIHGYGVGLGFIVDSLCWLVSSWMAGMACVKCKCDVRNVNLQSLSAWQLY